MSSGSLPPDFACSAQWLVQALDPQSKLVRLIEMDAEAYRGASFLDDRMLGPSLKTQFVGWDEIAGAMPAEARTDARWIFHIGHVGSTLIARMLGELPGVLSIREPRALREVAVAPAEGRARYLGPLPALFSRTFKADETALVKATSFVSERAADLVPPGERALFLYAKPEAYIGGILAGENSRKELQILRDSRSERMRSRVTGLDAGGDDAQLAAAAWACEMTALEAAGEAMADEKVAWVDFDAFLQDPGAGLKPVAEWLGFDTGNCEQVARGPLLGRYSKALEYEYSPALRRDLIAEARREHSAAIKAALAMLERAAQGSPLLARALSRTEP